MPNFIRSLFRFLFPSPPGYSGECECPPDLPLSTFTHGKDLFCADCLGWLAEFQMDEEPTSYHCSICSVPITDLNCPGEDADPYGLFCSSCAGESVGPR